ncbi:MAG: hypothetical protein RR314_05530 [Oscillospiraceae bacterium]
MENYISAAEAGKKWGLSARRVCTLCAKGRVPGTLVFARSWLIPRYAEKPADARIKTGKYIGFSEKYRKNKTKYSDLSSCAPSAGLSDCKEDI